MSSRKEMVPAQKREKGRASISWCTPEWNLLCRVRYGIKKMLQETTGVKTMRKLLKGIIAHMDDVFNDWPENPK